MGKIYFGEDGSQKKAESVKPEPEKQFKQQKHKKNGSHNFQSFDTDVKNLEKRWFEHVRILSGLIEKLISEPFQSISVPKIQHI